MLKTITLALLILINCGFIKSQILPIQSIILNKKMDLPCSCAQQSIIINLSDKNYPKNFGDNKQFRPSFDNKPICNMGLMTIGFPLMGIALGYQSFELFKEGKSNDGFGFLIASGIILSGYTTILIYCNRNYKKNHPWKNNY